MRRFITKRIQTYKPQKDVKIEQIVESGEINNKSEEKKVINMDTFEKITVANNILSLDNDNKVKKIRKDKGLIERTESSKIILTEDNRELLKD